MAICSTSSISKSANPTPRQQADFFLRPSSAVQRRYEALRAYFGQGLSVAEAGSRFGYSPQSLASLARDFRAGKLEFFLQPRLGPKSAPAKEAARAQILELRRAGSSLDEIATAIRAAGTPLNRTGIAEVLSQAGLPRLRNASGQRLGTDGRTAGCASPATGAASPSGSAPNWSAGREARGERRH